MKTILRSLFTFNRSERRGMIVLAGLTGACILFAALLPLIIPPVPAGIAVLAALPPDTQGLAPAGIGSGKPAYPRKPRPEVRLPHAPFDPNGLPLSAWVRMGLSARQAEVVKKYEARTGGFRSAEELQKCYVISESFYRQIAPYIQIRTAPLVAETLGTPSSPAPELGIDINSADTTELKKLRGIGSRLALRIIRFRQKLGSFHSVSQLRDIYGLPEETYRHIEKQCIVGPGQLRKISLNYASYTELLSLPYIDRETALQIVTYREKNGFFRTLDELSEKKLVNAEIYSKCVPYLVL